MQAALLDFAEQVKQGPSAEQLGVLLDAQLKQFGFNGYTYLTLRRPDGSGEPEFVSTYPTEWVQRYRDEGYVNFDELLPSASASVAPVNWNTINHADDKRIIFDEARLFGIKNGLTIPLHGPNGSFSALSMVSDMPEQDFDVLASSQAMHLHMLCFQYHQAMATALRPRAGSNDGFRFSARERECLLWTARGKSAWEISEILGLSQETVTGYLKTAAKKAGVFSKHHAVVKAIMMGLIVP